MHFALAACLLALPASLQDAQTPADVPTLLRQLGDDDASARAAAFETLRNDPEDATARKLAGELKRLRRRLLREAESVRKDAGEEARKSDYDSGRFKSLRSKAWKLFEAKDTKQMKTVVDEMWAMYFIDPEVLDQDPRVTAIAARVKQVDGWLEEVGETPDPPAKEALEEVFWKADEKTLMNRMTGKDKAVMRYNKSVKKKLQGEEYKLVFMTNMYRVMMGRPALKINVRLCNAARMHSKDMDENGFFSHTSPLPGKRTPQDRARMHGTLCGSENISSTGSGASGAFWGWFLSLGHHRNMLNAMGQIGIGNHGRYWTENF